MKVIILAAVALLCLDFGLWQGKNTREAAASLQPVWVRMERAFFR